MMSNDAPMLVEVAALPRGAVALVRDIDLTVLIVDPLAGHAAIHAMLDHRLTPAESVVARQALAARGLIHGPWHRPRH